MARVKLSPLLTEISGSIGGITIQRNKFGLSIRQKPIPLDKFTPAQAVIRAHIATIQAAWQDLTAAERLQWNRFLDYSGQTIRRNNSVKLSGHALYIKYQLFRLLAGFPLLTTITYVTMPEVQPFVAVTNIGTHLNVTFQSALDVSEYFFVILLSNPRQASRAFSPSGLRVCSTSYPPIDYTTYDIKSSYLAAFGALPVAGSYLHYVLQWWSVKSPVIGSRLSGIMISN